MCGIAGIVNFDGGPASREHLEKMNAVSSHRGPDGNGIFCRDNIGIAHCRLAIIDPETGAQPLYNDDRTIALSYNGEVYNYVELRNELAGEFAFKTHSDTEVVLHAYEKWGMACLERFRGMFAFALYDSNKKALYIARDRAGIKPLFYYMSAEQFIFSSELVPILKTSGIKHEISPESLSRFFRYQYVPTPASIYKDIYKLEPGCFLEVDVLKGKVTKHRYWDLKLEIFERSEPEWLERLNAVLDDTIRIYLRSDVPFGVFLSGGVDSSLVTALMAKHLEKPVRTFSIGFKEEAHSELQFAAEASRVMGTSHYEKIVTPELAEDILRKLVTHFGEPFADSSAIPTYYVSREAAGQVKMVLSGDGGDELFGGYNSYQTTFRDMNAHDMIYHRRRYDAARQAFDDDSLRQLLSPDIPVAPSVDFKANIAGRNVDPVTLFQAQDFKTYLVDDVLTKVDRMSMANSLEVRVPLLDHKIIETAFSLPLPLKIRFNKRNKRICTKYLLKKSASRFYAESFLARPKQGFGIPVAEWCRGPFMPLIESELRNRQNPVFEWLNFDYVQAMLDQFFSGRDGLAARIWFVFMFDLWRKHVHQSS
ncbi:MAG: asparagine synthase (glutamine-hydrolyzing) [Candidatus Omnitrophica bacterium]|nr:asparagine synthase (glutamine-hydrolyzing) [Candidatus Omnitrophota bacterium]